MPNAPRAEPMDTERHSPRYSAIDVWGPADILDAMIEGQFAAVAAVRAVRPALEAAALAMEPRLRDGGRLSYAGAGTSGRLAVQDGAELVPTFSWQRERLLLLIAIARSFCPYRAGGRGPLSLARTVWAPPPAPVCRAARRRRRRSRRGSARRSHRGGGMDARSCRLRRNVARRAARHVSGAG